MDVPARIFARRHYLHFDEPLSSKAAEALATNPERVAKWAFLPMLHWTIQAWKVKKNDDGGLEKKPPKNREISYAAHKDAAIYAYYGHMLGVGYEAKLNTLGIGDCITAFRQDSGLCNIDFAREAFEWIRTKRNCVALAFDIKGFFDNLDHAHLKAQWCRILKADRLPKDHFAVFRSLTKFAFADRLAVFEEFGVSPHNPRANDRTRICSAEQFRERVREKGLIQINQFSKGIPQGSPMSAALSNIYMLDFDAAVAQRVNEVGGLYRRYCDDMLCVVAPEHAAEVEKFVMQEIEKVKLEIQPEKTKRHCFRCKKDKVSIEDKTDPLQYLGFIFDGQRTLLRTASVARYYRKMRAGVRLAALTKAKHDKVRTKRGQPTEPLRRRKLNIRYSYIGRHNFISYALRAAKKMESLSIRKQMKRHWRKLNAEIEKAQKKIE